MRLGVLSSAGRSGYAGLEAAKECVFVAAYPVDWNCRWEGGVSNIDILRVCNSWSFFYIVVLEGVIACS